MALIALGSNLPLGKFSPLQTLELAISQLRERGFLIRARSRSFGSPCFPAGAGPDYTNAAIAAAWDGTAGELLALLHEVEAEFSRQRDMRWGKRTLDLDLIALGDAVAPDLAAWEKWRGLSLEDQMRHAPNELILPHPRMQDRAFVLVPLAEVAPNWRHPIIGQSVAEMLGALPGSERAQIKPL